jgi:hypothetical protein
MAVTLHTTPSLEVGAPRALFEMPDGPGFYDVAPDGDRFVLVRGSDVEPPSELQLVLNWASEL